jgi:tRNA(Ile)-lysidine synthase
LKGLPPLVAKVRRCLERFGLSPSCVVGVSGGPDSVALLLALVRLRGRAPAGPLVIGHVNHQLRGPESDADEGFVRDLHAFLVAQGVPGLELRCARHDARAGAGPRANPENHARIWRYHHLVWMAWDTGVPWIATGHTADDQAETVLHRLLRGTGLKGLRGIAVRRPVSGNTPPTELVRPLLAVTRAEVLAFLKEQGQPFRQDSSNLDVDFTRNRIRHELLPHLKERHNPAIAEVLGRLAEQAVELWEVEEQAARALLQSAERPRAGRLLIFDRRCLAAAPRHRVREALRLAWWRQAWPEGDMGFADWDRLAGLVFGEGTAVDLPGGIRARALAQVVQLGPAS